MCVLHWDTPENSELSGVSSAFVHVHRVILRERTTFPSTSDKTAMMILEGVPPVDCSPTL